MTNQCAHGNLSRQCELCDKDSEIERLTALVTDLLVALNDCEARIIELDVLVDSEWGIARSQEEMESDRAWSQEVYQARAVIARADLEGGK